MVCSLALEIKRQIRRCQPSVPAQVSIGKHHLQSVAPNSSSSGGWGHRGGNNPVSVRERFREKWHCTNDRRYLQREVLLPWMSHSFWVLFLFAFLDQVLFVTPPFSSFLLKRIVASPTLLSQDFTATEHNYLWKIKCYNSLRIKPISRTMNSFPFSP